MPRPTLFRALVQQRRWTSWASFCVHFERAARELARREGEHRLSTVTVSRRTFERWLAGDIDGLPRSDARRVLEHLLGHRADELFEMPPSPPSLQQRVPRTGTAGTLPRYGSQPLLPGSGHSAVWRLSGNRLFDGTEVSVQLQPVREVDGYAVVSAEDEEELDAFLRPTRRGLLLGQDTRKSDRDVLVIDTVVARARRSRNIPGHGLVIPYAYRLDDLTYGVIWALSNLDDGLLFDDQVLQAELASLEVYLPLQRSAVSRAAAPELATAGAAWLGSYFCARHLLRNLEGAAEPSAFWTREQYGEEAAGWLFFRHKHEYLRTLRSWFPGTGQPMSRSFCIPASSVESSPRYERVLMFLAIALMEMYGIRTSVAADPAYSAVEGFALVPGGKAVIANWVRAEGIWHVDTTGNRTAVSTYADAGASASAHSVATGETATERLERVADYLGLPWSWLVRRCGELGVEGAAGMLRARSRHLSLGVLDDTLRFIGALTVRRREPIRFPQSS